MNEFWKDAMKQFGVGVIFAVMLMFYYNQENKKVGTVCRDRPKKMGDLTAKVQ